MNISGGSLGLLTGMRLITGLELLFWFLAMITRICFKFEGKEKFKGKISPKIDLARNQIRKNAAEDEKKSKSEINDLTALGKLVQTQDYELLNRIIAMEEKNRAIEEKLKALAKAEKLNIPEC